MLAKKEDRLVRDATLWDNYVLCLTMFFDVYILIVK